VRFAEQWSRCIVDAVRDVTPAIREFRLRPDNGQVQPCPPGSHIGVAVLIDGQPARRSYSLVANSDPGTYRIAVRCGAHLTAAAARARCGICRPARGSKSPTPRR
jgi:ferredoxin-NADP reductase